MAEKTVQTSPLHRIILRFRTMDAPSDLHIIEEFYETFGLGDTLCFVHWQTREFRDTYVVIDVHNGTKDLAPNIQALPHEIYQLSWTSGCKTMWVEVCMNVKPQC
jgi:hypothetical protein